MREVAPADSADNASASSAAQATEINLAVRMPGIPCSPKSFRTRPLP